ncbi:MAG: 4Fe-4S dicluster domain-containing protein [Myxococcaceae bacterium]
MNNDNDSNDQARRNFLKLSGGAVVFLMGGAAVAATEAADAGLAAEAAPVALPPPPVPQAPSPPEAAEAYNWEEHQYAYLIDTSKCIGCGSCVRACKKENDVPDDFFRTWVERYLVSAHQSYVDSPNGGLDGFVEAHVPFVPTKNFFVPKMCNHCKETPCMQVCPVGASYKTKEGAILVDGERCIGCGYCVQACPYGSRFVNENTHTADKCTWCYHRITKGLKPACVSVCPTGTRVFGDMRNAKDPVRVAIEHERVTTLQPHHLTEPQCYYLALDKEVR